jgi:hypothetical protein
LHSVGTTLGGFRLHGNQISLVHAAPYEEEAKRIRKSLEIKITSSLIALKLIWNIKCISDKFHGKFLTYLSVKFQNLADKIHDFPDHIYYDFQNQKWEK